jgi:hypothetical protein
VTRPRLPTDPILGVVPGDPALRRIAFIGWLTTAALGAAAVWYVTIVMRHAEAMAAYDPRGAFLAVQRIAIPIMVAWTVAGAGLGSWCVITALRIIRAGRFPVPGSRVIRATPLRHGGAAHRIGVMIALVGLVVLGGSVAMPIFLRRVMQAVQATTADRFPAVPPSGPVGRRDGSDGS